MTTTWPNRLWLNLAEVAMLETGHVGVIDGNTITWHRQRPEGGLFAPHSAKGYLIQLTDHRVKE